MGCIYRAYCPASGKFYVGQSRHASWTKRYAFLRNGYKIHYNGGKQLSRWEKALNSHGLAGFQFRDLATNLEQAERDALEVFFIRHYDCTNPSVGYNTEFGGKRKKTFLASIREKSNEIRGIKVRWYHRDHGTVVSNASRLARLHGILSDSLNQTMRGLRRSHRGWVCLDAPIGKMKRGLAGVWSHPDRGVFVGDTRALKLHAPADNLFNNYLTEVRAGRRTTHRGWTFLRNPNKEEEIKFRVWWADQPTSDADSRIKKRPHRIKSPIL